MRAGHLRLLASVAAALLLCCASASAQLDVNLNRTATAAAAAKESTTARVSAVVADPEIKLADIHHSEIGKKHAAAAAKAAKAAAADDEDDDMYEYDMYDDDDYYGEEESSVSSSGKSAAKAEKPKATPAQPQQVIVKKNTLRTWDLKPIKDNALDEEPKPAAVANPTPAAAKHAAKHPESKAQLIDHDGIDGENADDDGPIEHDDIDQINGDDNDENADDDDDDMYDDDEDDDELVTPITPSYRLHRPTLKPAAAVQPKPTKPKSTATVTACPINCVCERNYNGFMVANCDRLDAETMHFDATITDLEVFNVAPRYPLLFDADFFKRIGLLHVRSITIVDSTIENVHPDAFRGLDRLYAVNLTNTGLDMLPPDAFAHNPKLRILALTGNDLHAMQARSSPFVDYMLNAPSLEELYLTRCNIKQLLETSFSRLPNVVFISLAENMLVTLPHTIFHKLSALEEVDLSSNSIENLPRHVFDNTSLSILSMRYNEMSGRPAFVAPNLQKLDLSYNKLKNVNDMFFTDMPNLNNLALKGNVIRKVHHAAFAPLKDLRHIDLSFNDLEQVSAMLFLENGYLDTIRLNDNARLKKLPLDGFASALKDFNVYLFDASNCDLGELGENTFATMPRLTTLSLAWNNIESVGSGLFSYLKKLVKLDLSNNLLSEMSETLFLHNRELHVLNLAGNPFERLSSKVFLPTQQLTQLDLSDCNLKSIWTEQTDMTGVHPRNLLKNLKSLNVSNNMIARVQLADVAALERLAEFDVSNNQLVCDRDFKDVMKWLEKKKIASGHLRTFIHETASEAERAALADKRSPWEEYALLRCHRLVPLATSTTARPRKPTKPAAAVDSLDAEHADDDGPIDDVADEDDDNDDDDDGDDDIIDSISDKANEKSTAAADAEEYDDDDGADDNDEPIKLSPAVVVDHGITVTEVKRRPGSKQQQPKVVDSAEIDGDYDDEEDDEEDEDDDAVSKHMPAAKKPSTVSVDADEDDEDNDDDDDDDDGAAGEDDRFDEDDAEAELSGFGRRLAITYARYSYVMPLLLVCLAVFVILACVAKIVSVMARRRGERYRLALLASKNSIVYQKLSEEINNGSRNPAPRPNHKQGRRYAQIQQV